MPVQRLQPASNGTRLCFFPPPVASPGWPTSSAFPQRRHTAANNGRPPSARSSVSRPSSWSPMHCSGVMRPSFSCRRWAPRRCSSSPRRTASSRNRGRWSAATSSGLVGVACQQLIPEPTFAAAAAVGLAIVAMHATRCIHPGGAMALAAVIGGPDIHQLGFACALVPVGLNCLLLIGVGIVTTTRLHGVATRPA